MYYKTASQRKNEKRAGLRDDFWLRSVLIPEIKREVSEISKNHIKWWKSYIKSLDSGANHASLNLADYLDKNFQEDTHFILMAIEKMETADTALFNTFTTAVQNFFEGLEEEIIEKCAEIETATSTEDKRSLAENIIKEFKFLTLNTLVELIVPHIKYSDTINKI